MPRSGSVHFAASSSGPGRSASLSASAGGGGASAVLGGAAVSRSASVGAGAAAVALRKQAFGPRKAPSPDGFRFYNSDVDFSLFKEKLPVVPYTVIAKLYAGRRWHIGSKPLVKGANDVIYMRHFPKTILVLPREMRGTTSIWVYFLSPSSFGKTVQYLAVLELEVEYPDLAVEDVADPSVLLPTATRVLHAHCVCCAGLSAHCTHISLSLHALYNFPRTDRKLQTPTCLSCRWNAPSDTWLDLVKLRQSGAVKASALVTQATRGGGLTSRNLSQDSRIARLGGRGGFAPSALLPDVDSAEVKALSREISMAQIEAYGGVGGDFFWTGSIADMAAWRSSWFEKSLKRVEAGEKAMQESQAAAVDFRSRSDHVSLFIPPGMAAAGAADAASGAGAGAVAAAEADGEAAAASDVHDRDGADSRLSRPHFQSHPDEVVLDPNTPVVHAATNRESIYCQWCGWRRPTSATHKGGECTVWDATRRKAWADIPLMRKRSRADYPFAIPDYRDPDRNTFRKAQKAAAKQRDAAADADAESAAAAAAAGPRAQKRQRR